CPAEHVLGEPTDGEKRPSHLRFYQCGRAVYRRNPMPMTPARLPRKRPRPYLASGMHRRTPPSPEVLQAMAEYRAELIAHRGGEENITATLRSKIEIAVAVRFRRL